MPDAFTVLWTHDTCRALRKDGRTGERPPVAFSGVHTSLPTWSGATAGDEVYALHVNRRVVHVVSRMRVLDTDRRDCCGATPTTWQDPAYPGHADWWMLGAGGCGAEPVHVDATPVRFDTPIPGPQHSPPERQTPPGHPLLPGPSARFFPVLERPLLGPRKHDTGQEAGGPPAHSARGVARESLP
ncbi:hypothetical protein [Streptomyces sp. NPDC018693]|uniref:hypothetical protein n=1 Tax=unclassified Streptomyces TaxID=2593676 RepID=UPI0037BDDBF3